MEVAEEAVEVTMAVAVAEEAEADMVVEDMEEAEVDMAVVVIKEGINVVLVRIDDVLCAVLKYVSIMEW